MCSTPFGIKGSFTVGIGSGIGVGIGCSTPFGIKGSFTHPSHLFKTFPEGAQRLSASKVLSPAARADSPRPPILVLNAFRHQRFFHIYIHAACCFNSIVLNAFRHQRFFHGDQLLKTCAILECSTPFGIKGSFTVNVSPLASVFNCAQRLSASKVLSRLSSFLYKLIMIVLNAFRHQRFFHCTTEYLLDKLVLVLNAFRHQRFFHPSLDISRN